jgi:hypothetical protein
MSTDAARIRGRPAWGLVKWTAAGLLGLVLLVSGLFGMKPVVIWTHLAGTEVHVAGTDLFSYTDSSHDCRGWVLAPGVAPPKPLIGNLLWAPTTTAAQRAQSREVTVKGGRCADGDYWALRASDNDVWSRSPDFKAVGDVGFSGLLAFMGGSLIIGSYRGVRRVLRDGPDEPVTRDTPIHRSAQLRGVPRAESRFLRTLTALVTTVGVLVAAGLGFFVFMTVFWALQKAVPALGFTIPLMGFVGIGVAIFGYVRLNRWLAARHLRRLRRNGTALPGVVADTRSRFVINTRGPSYIWVVLAIEFTDPSTAAEHWLKRSYRFRRAEVHQSTSFEDDYGAGTKVNVFQSKRKIWYAVDIDAARLYWTQRW